jgi:hypothetical protein
MKIVYRICSRIIPDIYFPYLSKKWTRKYNEFIKTEKNKNKRESLYWEKNNELRVIDDDWEEIRSNKMKKLAIRYDLVIPKREKDDNDENWDLSYIGSYYLNSVGRNKIKMQLREEQKWNRDRITIIGTIFLGLIGGITGLLSIILKK